MIKHNPFYTKLTLPAFGSLKNGRNFSAGSGYKYGMNTQQKDDEIFVGAYTAEFWEYDSRLGRRWNLDPITNFSLSSYQCFNNNPIIFIDPFGNTDFYNNSGLWIGTDGDISKNIQTVITSKKLEKEISRISRKGGNYIKTLPNGKFYTLPENKVIEAAVKTYELSIQKTSTDIIGGLHEVLTTFDNSGNQSEYLIGKDVLNSGDKHVAAEERKIETGSVIIHSHPTEYVLDLKTDINSGKVLKTIYDADASEPSENDIEISNNFNLSIIVGKNGHCFYEESVEIINGTNFNKSRVVDNRKIMANFYSKGSKSPVFSISINSLKKITSNEGKNKSEVYKKYNKKHK